MEWEKIIGQAIERAFDAGYKAGIDDTLKLKDDELRELVALALGSDLVVVK